MGKWQCKQSSIRHHQQQQDSTVIEESQVTYCLSIVETCAFVRICLMFVGKIPPIKICQFFFFMIYEKHSKYYTVKCIIFWQTILDDGSSIKDKRWCCFPRINHLKIQFISLYQILKMIHGIKGCLKLTEKPKSENTTWNRVKTTSEL